MIDVGEKRTVSGLGIVPVLLTKADIRKNRFVCYLGNDKRYHLMKIGWMYTDEVTLEPVQSNSMQRKFKLLKNDFEKCCYRFMAQSQPGAKEAVNAEIFLTPYNWQYVLEEFREKKLVSVEISTKKFVCSCTQSCNKQHKTVPCPDSSYLIHEARIISSRKTKETTAISILSRYDKEICNFLKKEYGNEILPEEIELVHSFLFENNLKLNEKLD